MLFNWGVKREELARLGERLHEVELKTIEWVAKVKLLETDMELLRGQFNRKLSGVKKRDIDEAGVLQTNPLY